jgi:DNA polymerase-3 subunit delta'
MNTIFSWQRELWRLLAPSAQPAEGKASLGHALLLRGRKGIGKLVFARCLAKSLLCRQPAAEGLPCGECASCAWFESGGHPDFRLIEPQALSDLSETPDPAEFLEAHGEKTTAETSATGEIAGGKKEKAAKKPSKQIVVEQIRNAADFINISSHQNGYKIVLIHPAETMNAAAANALLKNLEEPPPRTLFILVTHQAQYLLPTIRSRCRQVAMPAPDRAVALDWLRQQGIKSAETCLASAGYAPLAALEFSDSNYLELYDSFMQQVSDRELNPVALADRMQKADLATVVSWLQKWCYDLMSFCVTGKIRYHLDRAAAIRTLARAIDPQSLSGYLRSLDEAQQLAAHSLNPRLFLENILFSYVKALSRSSRGSTSP